MRDQQFNVKIADFGLSLTTAALRQLGHKELVASGRAGTWPYEAPQVAVDSYEYGYGIESDYWSLVVIVFEMETDEYCDYVRADFVRNSSCAYPISLDALDSLREPRSIFTLGPLYIQKRFICDRGFLVPLRSIGASSRPCIRSE